MRYIVLLTTILFSSAGQAVGAEKSTNNQVDLTRMELEQLLDVEYVSAAKIANQISDANTAISIVTADDIRAYGYRSMAEIVNSMRGLYTPYDGSIYYLGGRGFGRSGDYVGRILLMIDGYATNDNIYDEAYIGNDGLLDTELIDRVEYVPGSGSAIYGNNAFFGIINIITKKGHDFDGTQVSGEIASFGGKKGRVTYGKRFDNGADILLSASALHSDGQDFYYPEFNNPTSNYGVAASLDFERSQRVFGKLQFEGISVEGGYVSRRHANPTGAYGTVFNALTWDWDTNGFVSLKSDNDISSHVKASSHVYYGYYLDRTALTDPTLGFIHEHNRGQWVGGDVKFVGNWFDHHKLVFGAEYRNDFEISFENHFGTSDYSRETLSLYAQDEMIVTDNLKFNLGGRIENSTGLGTNISPRAALIYTPFNPTTIKFSYSSAFRRPSAYEQFYHDGTQAINPTLGPEFVKSTELTVQQQFSRNMRAIASLYHYQTSDIITSMALPSGLSQNVNSGGGHANGLELEVQRLWDNGVRLHGSYAKQFSTDSDGLRMVNSPKDLAKINLTFPMLQNSVRTGVEVQTTSSRYTEKRMLAAGYTVANLTFSSEHPVNGLNASFSIKNLFDRHYVSVAPVGLVQDTLQMDGRNFWLQVDYSFK
ncbi:TonB-dependent siderophore receptor [Methylotenera sp.]|uniref:TonB-dependent receptor plug domain-containing protein n=1 Tax=Methylotenera sp. TaxID=2051956 RepID=UPI00248A26B1|nr:TonB-dependent receptor [Methylotenera sp.]MDI1300188.1 TonB-dependent receptor [Methylotenera sp.]